MAQTIAEKLLTRNNLKGEMVRAGDFLEARIDGAMCHYHGSEPLHTLAQEMGFKDGMPRVWDTDRVFVLLDHHQPALSQALADENKLMRKVVDRLGGSISAEHGVGQLKRESIKPRKSAVELELMQRVKDALDPQGIMNPGKVL